ncbi:MAG TPA: Dabb family protein [Vicinamibacteria bacterium]|nr:Dabb family protein [Vicinamibacteria bacterium]
MICHIVLVRLKQGVSEADGREFMTRAERLLGSIPAVRNLRIGRGLGVKSEREHPIAIVMDFEDETALESYQIHPDHQRFVSDILGPIQDDKRVYDYRV